MIKQKRVYTNRNPTLENLRELFEEACKETLKMEKKGKGQPTQLIKDTMFVVVDYIEECKHRLSTPDDELMDDEEEITKPVAKISKREENRLEEESILKEAIEAREGELLEPYKNQKKPLKICCKSGHEFELRADNLKRGDWCVECKKIEEGEDYKAKKFTSGLADWKRANEDGTRVESIHRAGVNPTRLHTPPSQRLIPST